MARRSKDAAEQAANAASEAARTLGQRSAEVRAERTQVEPAAPSEKPEAHPFRNLEPRNEPRRKAMEEIEQRDMRENKWKAGEEPVVEEKKPEIPNDPPPPTAEQMLEGGKFSQAAPEEPKPDAKTAPEVPAEPAKPALVKVKIDGEEEEVAQSVIDEAGGLVPYRINRAAEKRFEKFKAELTKERIAAMQQQPAKPVEPDKPQVSDQQFIASKLDEIRFGTPEQGAAALQEILQRAAPKPVDENGVTNRVLAHMKYNSAEERFAKDYADVLSNPILAKAVNVMKNEAVLKHVQNGTPNWQSMVAVDWNEVFNTIGVQVRSAAGRQSQPATTQAASTTGNPSQGQSEKEARKASIVNLPTAAARAELPKDSKPDTREDILNEMRKKRGIPIG